MSLDSSRFGSAIGRPTRPGAWAGKTVRVVLANSLIIAGGALLSQLSVSVSAACAPARKRFRGQAVALLVILPLGAWGFSIFCLSLQKSFLRGITTGAIKG
ncbi:hypothetical protein SAMN05216188_104399 [Lentzea xinjiangensis]|uniref:Uncharacterized protein n=1 Tax=Lentzea xinjiangensis TaxID=402600 RepID=A0A1H9I924_9PSEU|nr:hypothetical protein [Lentzea xinjiangensis]SEQ71046.1 hypothetical protein SAMN05216188_104399 [Lentzea xinjiangensis]